jgi:hypothetical protein
MSTPCHTTGRLCDTPGPCSQPGGCVLKVRSLVDELLQRTPEQERQRRKWMYGDFEATDTVVSRINVRQCTLGVGCNEVGQCYTAAHGEPGRCGAL